ncbi:poly-beta-1,6 N-acetyl-D-glucosamine export porin PgaA [Kluyvera ascorbata]|uniref:poly-beta-1,6 N-acetyl-D-glucosamine export porin PgaA n=1 Tax=Kluyvera ascorbata TaxID=51288 RepID=UPI0022E1C04A|nr:poly-beta-1,6 N-acetyl-D-glucosamine export porin PgaA [Kluyvera ascorbata]
MESTVHFNKSYLYHRATLSISISLLLLLPGRVLGTESIYDQQIQQARDGNYAPYLLYVQRYEQHHPLTSQQVADWLQVASWAGRDRDVIHLWERYQVYMPMPARAIAATAQSWRNLHQWDNALPLWEQAITLSPDNDDYRISYVKTLADAGKDDLALQEAQRLLASQPSLSHLQTLAYVYQRQGKNADRLLVDTRILNRGEDTPEIRQEWVDALTQNRIDSPALSFSREITPSPEQQRRLALNDAASMVRVAALPTRTEQERFVLPQRTLSRYRTLLTRWEAQPDAQADRYRAQIDRLGALYANADYPGVISAYQSLIAQCQSLPDWAIGWVISAYLEQKNANAAFALLAQHPNYKPDPDDDRQDLFFALLNTGHYEAAREYVDSIVKQTPWARYDYGNPSPQPNDRWLTGQSLYFQYLLQTHSLPEAEALAQHLTSTAPGNQGLKIDYATLLQARGLPRAAERTLKMAEALEPTNIELERQQAYVAIDLHEWQQMELLTNDVVARTPKDTDSRDLARMRSLHHFSELKLNVGKGLHSDNPISGSHDLSWDATLYGPPIDGSWRPFAGSRFAQGQFEEGKGISRQQFGGIEWRPRDFWAEAEVSSIHFHGTRKTGARLSTRYSLGDSWQIGSNLERISRTTPLRALRSGISANRGEAWLRWYQNERREYRLSAALSDFTDGNRRQEYTLTGSERLWQTPALTLSLMPELSASTNSRVDTDYYNPARDFSAAATFALEHLMYRHYDTLWSQQLLAGGGGYWQKAQAPGAITLAGYGQRIQWNNVVDTGVVLSWDKRPYDGKRESNLAIAIDATLRF